MSHRNPYATKVNHKYVPWIVSLASTAVFGFMFVAAAVSQPTNVFDFTWRWFAVPVTVSIVAVALLYSWAIRVTRVRKGVVYWFALLLTTNVIWLTITLFQTLSATPEAAAYWQGMLPLGWIPVPLLILFFVLSYIDDTDMPLAISAWVPLLAALILLVFTSGMTGLVESHVPNQTTLAWYGYVNQPGSHAIYVLAWASVLGFTSLWLAYNAYRRETNATKKRQLRLFLIALLQYVVIGWVTDIVIYPIFPDAFPPMSFLYVTTLCLIFAYGIIKYGLFQFNATSLAEPILHNMAEGVIGVNAKLEVEFTNSGARHMLGYEQVNMYGTSIGRLFSENSFAVLKQRLADTASASISVDESIIVSCHGQHIPVALNISRVVDDRDEHVGYIVVMQNITELKKKTVELQIEKQNVEKKVVERTKQLHEEQARLKASIDDLALGFMMLDDKNNIIIQNHELQRILEFKQSFATLVELGTHLGHFDIESHYKKSLKSRRHFEAKEVGTGAKILHVYMSPVLAPEGTTQKAIGVVILIEDITEMKVLERSRDEFFSIASHELRTPLTAIRGNASMALQYYGDSMGDPALKEVITDIHDSSVRLIEIVNDFLDSSRLEQGKFAFEPAECSMDEIIESVAYEMRAVINEKKIKLQLERMVLHDLPKIWADRNRVKQIIYNLVGNAVKYTDTGTITISSEARDGFVHVQVKDTGRGISLKNQKLLFHKLQQAGESLLTRDTTRGTGLGLYISKMLADKMGGKLALVQSKEGQGSTFELSLPIDKPKHPLRAGEIAKQIDLDTGLTIQ